jgi:pyruvate decarboxylase
MMRLPTGACIIAQYLWCSIGFGTAACSGAAVAAERCSPASNVVAKTVRKRRVVGLLGDGSFQMTCQEISTMVREGVGATLLILNNKGYTIGDLKPNLS